MPTYRSLPLLSSDLPYTTINVSHSFMCFNDQGKEVLSFTIFLNPGNGQEGWKVEKTYSDVLSLDKRVRNSVGKGVGKKMADFPEGKLWKDHTSIKVDQRKAVLESYLQTLIRVPVKNNEEIIAFFTSNIVRDQKQLMMHPGHKEGYLTKQGKNFAGWRKRFFVLQGPVLEYYDTSDGAHLGSIVITGAQITRQYRTEVPPPDEKEYRHAFLIIEAEKGFGGSQSCHVLCAESDEDRNSWVEMLLPHCTGVYSDDLSEPLTAANDQSNGPESEFLGMGEEEEADSGQDATPGDIIMGDPRTNRIAPNAIQIDKQLPESLETNGLLYPMDSLSLGNSRSEISNPDSSNKALGLDNPMMGSLTTAASPLDLSASVSRDITHPVHGGSYADIYSGILSRKKQSIKVAIKVIRAHIYTEANQWKINKRLKREIRVWSCLQHPNIVPLLGTTQGFGPYTGMVCPWMSEGDLNHYLKDRKPSLSLKRRLGILSDVVEGLAYLHTRSIVHGDLTTGNILMEDGKAHLSDFGLSNIIAETRNGSLLTSTVGGAIRWVAPELYQIDTDPNVIPAVTKPCDVYSFGSVTLEVISGKIPYYDITSDHQVLLKVMTGVRPARLLEKLLTDAAWELITLCWTRDPRHRPSIEEVRRLLQDLKYGCSADLLESIITS